MYRIITAIFISVSMDHNWFRISFHGLYLVSYQLPEKRVILGEKIENVEHFFTWCYLDIWINLYSLTAGNYVVIIGRRLFYNTQIKNQNRKIKFFHKKQNFHVDTYQSNFQRNIMKVSFLASILKRKKFLSMPLAYFFTGNKRFRYF